MDSKISCNFFNGPHGNNKKWSSLVVHSAHLFVSSFSSLVPYTHFCNYAWPNSSVKDDDERKLLRKLAKHHHHLTAAPSTITKGHQQPFTPFHPPVPTLRPSFGLNTNAWDYNTKILITQILRNKNHLNTIIGIYIVWK